MQTCKYFFWLIVLGCYDAALAQQCVVDPLWQYTQLGGNPEDNKIYVDADTSEANYLQAIFSGSVRLTQGDKHIIAPHLIYEQESGTAKVEDGGVFASTNFAIQGEKGRYDADNEVVIFERADYLLANAEQYAVGWADNARFDQKQRLDSLEKVNWTTCTREAPTWQIAADSLTLNRDQDRGVARDLTFRIKGTPVLYLPYFSFPLNDERQSGLLTPSVMSSESRGIEFAIPYYWNIAPNQDATLALRPMTKRGVMLEGEYRLLTEKFDGQLSGGWIGSDKKSPLSKRWNLKLNGRYRFDEQWRVDVLWQAVSDVDYIDNFRHQFALYEDWYLERYLGVIGETDYGNFLFRVQDFERVSPKVSEDSKPYRRLPQLKYQHAWQDKDWRYALGAEAVRFGKEGVGAATRLNVNAEVAYRWQQSYGFVEPKMSIDGTHYHFDSGVAGFPSQNVNRVLPTLSLDGGLLFERNIKWLDEDWTQTIESRLFYLYTPYKKQTHIPLFDSSETSRSWNWLFARNRFTGGDRIGDANQLTTALTTRFYSADDGQEKLRLSLGQVQYFKDRFVGLEDDNPQTRGKSVFITEGAYQIDRHWDVYALSFWDGDARKNQRDVVRLRYKLDDDRFVSLSHRYAREHYDQLTLSGVWRFNPQWRGFVRQDYSLHHNKGFNTVVGIEYNDCCWAWRMAGKSYRDSPNDNDRHNAVYLEFVLKGLGNMGNRSSRLLAEEISGFNPLKEEKTF